MSNCTYYKNGDRLAIKTTNETWDYGPNGEGYEFDSYNNDNVIYVILEPRNKSYHCIHEYFTKKISP